MCLRDNETYWIIDSAPRAEQSVLKQSHPLCLSIQVSSSVGRCPGDRVWLEVHPDEFWFQHQFGELTTIRLTTFWVLKLLIPEEHLGLKPTLGLCLSSLTIDIFVLCLVSTLLELLFLLSQLNHVWNVLQSVWRLHAGPLHRHGVGGVDVHTLRSPKELPAACNRPPGTLRLQVLLNGVSAITLLCVCVRETQGCWEM